MNLLNKFLNGVYTKEIFNESEELDEYEFYKPLKNETKKQYIYRHTQKLPIDPKNIKMFKTETIKKIIIEYREYYSDLYDQYKNNGKRLI